jgi:hypothetical protein
MEYQSVASQYYYYKCLEVQLLNASYDSNSYFASHMVLMLMLLVITIVDPLHWLIIMLIMVFTIHIIMLDIMFKIRCQLFIYSLDFNATSNI